MKLAKVALARKLAVVLHRMRRFRTKPAIANSRSHSYADSSSRSPNQALPSPVTSRPISIASAWAGTSTSTECLPHWAERTGRSAIVASTAGRSKS